MNNDFSFCSFEIESGWKSVLAKEFKKPYIFKLESFIAREEASGIPIYPPKNLIFNALKQTRFNDVKVVIIGQDPYHGPGQAHGLSFSVPKGVPPPPSLKNIYKELANDVGLDFPTTGCLTPWAKQGVLLLNTTLTVRQGEPGSHQGIGWELFTDAIITKLIEREEPLVFVLWGNFAKMKCRRIEKFKKNIIHSVITAAHPSPLSAYRGFFGCHHFSKINAFLKQSNRSPINWNLT